MREANKRATSWIIAAPMTGLDQLGKCSPVMNIYIYSKIDWDEVQKSRRMVVLNPFTLHDYIRLLNPLVNLLIILKLTCLIKRVITQLHSQNCKTTPPCIFCTSANAQ